MPKNKFQEVIFTIIMVFFMVYAMICYNIVLNTGAMTNSVFLSAFRRIVNFRNCHPFSMILAISVASVAFMCPLMSFFATLFFKHAGNQFIAVWLQTTFMNFPVAFFWQLIYAGPIVRFIFRHIFPEKEDSKETAPNM